MNDVGFVDALLDTLEESYCLDLDRQYATGFSNGGIFSWELGKSLPYRFAAVSPGGGQPFVGFVEPPDLSRGHRISLFDVHGDIDTICPPFGGKSEDDPAGEFKNCDGWLYASVSHGTRVWAEAHGCSGGDKHYRTEAHFDKHVMCYKHGECDDSAEFVRCLWRGAHYWPAIPTTLDGSRLVWWFFKNHPKIHPSTDVEQADTCIAARGLSGGNRSWYSTRSGPKGLTLESYAVASRHAGNRAATNATVRV